MNRFNLLVSVPTMMLGWGNVHQGHEGVDLFLKSVSMCFSASEIWYTIYLVHT
jgi:hypothetical protein